MCYIWNIHPSKYLRIGDRTIYVGKINYISLNMDSSVRAEYRNITSTTTCPVALISSQPVGLKDVASYVEKLGANFFFDLHRRQEDFI